ncbi:hypothetical protein OkiPb00531_49900 [Escherichia coli]|nr:hypothetical protein ECEC4439_0296 [Escherichia coli EC4439]ERC06680.1 hypothetical protein QYO_2757 [Escherichia coli B29-1]BDM84218.1 hypothetical protein CL8F690_02790 [Escherichia coli]ERC14300.1 hypothetical protein QYO_0441 [Escherichia coli B29-1]BDN00204.1 hypothetical protein CL8NIID8_02800 [Escherichia coli]
MAQSAFLGKGMLNVILIVCVDNVGVTAPRPYCRIFPLGNFIHPLPLAKEAMSGI